MKESPTAYTDGTAFSPSRTTRAIHFATFAMSASLKPRLVTAGVPTRTPLVTNGERVSFGTVFLITVMFASSSSVYSR